MQRERFEPRRQRRKTLSSQRMQKQERLSLGRTRDGRNAMDSVEGRGAEGGSAAGGGWDALGDLWWDDRG